MTSEVCTIVLSDDEDSEVREIPASSPRTRRATARHSQHAGASRAVSVSNRPRTRRRSIGPGTSASLRVVTTPRASEVIDLTAPQASQPELLIVSSTKSRQRSKKVSAPSPSIVITDDVPPETPHVARCGICFDKMDDRMACGPCGHVFCEKCLKEAVKVQKKCPTCRKSLQIRQIHKVFINM